MADPVRVLVRAAVLGFQPREVAEVDRDDKHVAAAIAGKHLIVLDDDEPADGPDLDALRTALATALGDDAIAAELVASIAGDATEAVDPLRRAGITFTDAQVANIAELAAAGDTAGAQAILVGEAMAQVGGPTVPTDEELIALASAMEDGQGGDAAARLVAAIEADASFLARLADVEVRLTDDQQANIVALFDAGDLLGAQEAILAAFASDPPEA